MSKKEEYIDRLLSVIKSLETSVSVAKDEDTLSFSFFRNSFKKGQEISTLIHELEMLQIEDMKHQMEKLIIVLSEEDKKQTVIEEPKQDFVEASLPIIPLVNEASTNNIKREHKEAIAPTVEKADEQNKEQAFVSGNYSASIELPTYINPNSQIYKPKKSDIMIEGAKEKQPNVIMDVISQNNNSPSINDIVQVTQPKVDVKRSFSLNDRFYFQRELFNNNREEMDSMMTSLGFFNNSKDIEEYLKENTSWDLEEKIVQSFLDIIFKGLNK